MNATYNQNSSRVLKSQVFNDMPLNPPGQDGRVARIDTSVKRWPSVESLSRKSGLQRSDCRFKRAGDILTFTEYFDENNQPWFYNYGASPSAAGKNRSWISSLCIPEETTATKLDDGPPREPDPLKTAFARKKKRMKSRGRIKDLINCNELEEFLTLTFAVEHKEKVHGLKRVLSTDDQKVRKLVWKVFDNFKRKFQRKHGRFPYVVILEKHDSSRTRDERKRGTYHLHIALKGVYGRVGQEEIQNMWGYGIADFIKFENGTDPGAYMAKYLTKDVEEWGLNEKSFSCSQGLKRPTLIRDRNDAEYVLKVLPARTQVYDGKVKFENTITHYKSGGQINPSGARVRVWNLRELGVMRN